MPIAEGKCKGVIKESSGGNVSRSFECRFPVFHHRVPVEHFGYLCLVWTALLCTDSFCMKRLELFARLSLLFGVLPARTGKSANLVSSISQTENVASNDVQNTPMH